MENWLKAGLLQAAANRSEALEGYVLGRGLPYSLMEEMQVGLWKAQAEHAPEGKYRSQHGERGDWRAGWLTLPYWSPSGRVLGVEYRTWSFDEKKKVRDYRLPRSEFNPTFIGMAPSIVQKIWAGGSVWLVEGAFDLCISKAIPKGDVALACGTARLSRFQLQFLRRFLGRSAMVHVAFDMDETGQKQLTGFYDRSKVTSDRDPGKWIPGVPARLEKAGIRARPVRYSGGKDPGEIWDRGGVHALKRAFQL